MPWSSGICAPTRAQNYCCIATILAILRFDFRLERVCKRNLVKVLGIGLQQWRTLRKFVDGILEIFIGPLWMTKHIYSRLPNQGRKSASSNFMNTSKIEKLQHFKNSKKEKIESQPLGLYSNNTHEVGSKKMKRRYRVRLANGIQEVDVKVCYRTVVYACVCFRA